MKNFAFTAILLCACFAGHAQTGRIAVPASGTGALKCISFARAIRLSYPDTLQALLLSQPVDIKAEGGTFVIQVCDFNAAASDTLSAAVRQSPDSIPDACYSFVKTYTTKRRLRFREYSCSDGAAGHTYYTYLYRLQHKNKTILLKFTNAHCNACTDAQGQSIPYDEEKSTLWLRLILNSVKLL